MWTAFPNAQLMASSFLRRRRVLRSEPADGMSREERTSGEKLRSARKIALVNNFFDTLNDF